MELITKLLEKEFIDFINSFDENELKKVPKSFNISPIKNTNRKYIPICFNFIYIGFINDDLIGLYCENWNYTGENIYQKCLPLKYKKEVLKFADKFLNRVMSNRMTYSTFLDSIESNKNRNSYTNLLINFEKLTTNTIDNTIKNIFKYIPVNLPSDIKNLTQFLYKLSLYFIPS